MRKDIASVLRGRIVALEPLAPGHADGASAPPRPTTGPGASWSPVRLGNRRQQAHGLRGGERRDSAWYAVIDDDWPAVKTALERRLAAKH